MDEKAIEALARGANRCGHSLDWSRAIARRQADELDEAGYMVVAKADAEIARLIRCVDFEHGTEHDDALIDTIKELIAATP